MKLTYSWIAGTLILAGTSLMAVNSSPKLKDLATESYSLDGIVDDGKSTPFACSFGKITVKIQSRDKNQIAATLTGGGMLINSGWLHTSVGMNPEITYHFPANAAIKDGSILSVVCNSLGNTPGNADVTYYVKHR